jgi:hypothetical protein
VGFHVPDFLVERVVSVKHSTEIGIAGFQFGDQVAVFRKHGISSGKKRLLNHGALPGWQYFNLRWRTQARATALGLLQDGRRAGDGMLRPMPLRSNWWSGTA